MHAHVYNILAIIQVIDSIKDIPERAIAYAAVDTNLSTCKLLENALVAIRKADDASHRSIHYLAEYDEICAQLEENGHKSEYVHDDGTVKFSSSWDFMTEPIIEKQYKCYLYYDTIMQVARVYNQLARMKIDHENYFVQDTVEIQSICNKHITECESMDDIVALCETTINDAYSNLLNESYYSDKYHETAHKIVRDDVCSQTAHRISLESLSDNALEAEQEAEYLLELAHAYNEYLISNVKECV